MAPEWKLCAPAGRMTLAGLAARALSAVTVWVTSDVLRHCTVWPERIRMAPGLKLDMPMVTVASTAGGGGWVWAGPVTPQAARGRASEAAAIAARVARRAAGRKADWLSMVISFREGDRWSCRARVAGAFARARARRSPAKTTCAACARSGEGFSENLAGA